VNKKTGLSASLAILAGSAMAASPPTLLEFATKDLGWMLAAEVPIQEKLGAVAFRGDRAAAPQGLEFYHDSNERKFDKWCGKQGGKVAWETGDAVMSKTAGFLWPTAATKEDASWVCKAKDGTAIAAVLRGATQKAQVDYWGGGKIPAYEFRYAVFDGPSWVGLVERRDTAFAAYQARAESNAAAIQEKVDRETARLRADPKVGDETALGMIIEVKPPLALIQVRADRREGRNTSHEWVKIESLLPR
jgi:hypothetical protein